MYTVKKVKGMYMSRLVILEIRGMLERNWNADQISHKLRLNFEDVVAEIKKLRG
jgi:hypothetical protein